MAARTETFPKQSARHNDNDFGSWINLPYFGGDASERSAILNGDPVGLGAFLDAAEAAAIAPRDLVEPETTAEDPFHEGPPCLQLLHTQGGFVEGTRNEGMMAVIVYLKKRYGELWEKHLDQYNRVMADLPAKELVQLAKSNERKDYTYACKKSPISDCCQRRVCTRREFGVGDGPQDGKGYHINALTRYDSVHGDEPMWGMEINGKRLMVSNSQFYSRDEFNRAAMAQANVVPIHMTPAKWLRYLAEIIVTADVVQMPEDAGPTGQLWAYIETFTLQGANAIDKEEIFLGKPYRAEGMVYFRSTDLFRYLDARHAKYPSPQHVWNLLKKHDAGKEEWHLKDRFVNVWCLPIDTKWDENTDQPKMSFEPSDDF